MARLLTLLLITQVTAEWVEISQQHYRKPLRTHSPFTTPDKAIHVEDATKPWSYNNRSVTEYNWNRNPTRSTNIGKVKRVQQIGSTTKTIDRVQEEEDDLDLHVDFRDYELRPNGLTRPAIEHDTQKGMIERVPNVGNIKRVQLNNSPVKSPIVNYKGDREQYSHNRHDNNPHDNHNDDEENDFEQKKNTEAVKRIYLNKGNHPHGTERTPTFPPDDEESSFTEEITTFNTEKPKQQYKNHTKVRDFYSTKPTFITESGDFTNYESERDRFSRYKITNSKSSEVTDQMNIFTTEIVDTDDEKKMSSKSKPVPTKHTLDNVHKNVNDFKAESHEKKVQVSRNDEKTANPMANDHKTKTKGNNDEPKQELEKENIKVKKGNGTTKAEKNKVNTMENVIKFMRVVAETISKNSRRTFSGKMQYLHELKETILANIEQRIDAAWPDDDSAGARRRSRSAHASPRGHVQFPSSESALMTISFLTFAVFLIKLVLQVIQTYKQKAMMVAPLMVASGRNVFTHQGHH